MSDEQGSNFYHREQSYKDCNLFVAEPSVNSDKIKHRVLTLMASVRSIITDELQLFCRFFATIHIAVKYNDTRCLSELTGIVLMLMVLVFSVFCDSYAWCF